MVIVDSPSFKPQTKAKQMTMPTNENPDFISLDMDVSPVADAPVADAPDDFIAIEMDAPIPAATTETPEAMPEIASDSPATIESTLANLIAPVTGSTSGSQTDGTMRVVGFSDAQGYVTALANGTKQATADSYVHTLRTRYGFTDDQIAALTITIIPESTVASGALAADGVTTVTHEGPNVFEQRRLDRGLTANARIAPAQVFPAATATPPAAPTFDRGLLPRDQILRTLVEESPGIVLTMSRAERRSTHHSLASVRAAYVAAGCEHMAPRRKSDKRQFGEVMRSLNTSETRAWSVTRRDMARVNQDWPSDLVARWCVGTLDGSDSLGSLGEKVLIADLVETAHGSEIRFTGGSDVLREKVESAFATRCGEMSLNATDLLTHLRDRVLPEYFHAIDCAGAIYVPGNSDRLSILINAIRPIMSRRISIWDAVSGASLTSSLLQGLDQMLDEIEADYGTDVEKAQERERNKIRKQRTEYTDEDLDLAARRAVVLPERAGTYLRRLNDAQAYLDGLKKLLGDDTTSVKERLAGLRATIEPLCDSTSAMGAAIEMD